MSKLFRLNVSSRTLRLLLRANPPTAPIAIILARLDQEGVWVYDFFSLEQLLQVLVVVHQASFAANRTIFYEARTVEETGLERHLKLIHCVAGITHRHNHHICGGSVAPTSGTRLINTQKAWTAVATQRGNFLWGYAMIIIHHVIYTVVLLWKVAAAATKFVQQGFFIMLVISRLMLLNLLWRHLKLQSRSLVDSVLKLSCKVLY